MKTDKANIKGLEIYNPGKNTADIILNANENPVNITADYIDEIKNMLENFEFNRYPDTNSDELRTAYGEYCNQPAERIICGNGSDEIIRLLLEAYVDKGENIVVHNPTFSMYSITAGIVGGNTIKVEDKNNFKMDTDALIETAKAKNAKVVFLCNPNNPTGSVFSREDIVKVIRSVKSVVAVDEAYIEFGGESVVDLTDNHGNLIVLRTMSKAFGLPGLRIGFGVGSREIIDSMYKVKAPYNLNQLSQNIGVIALKHLDNMQKQVALIKENKTQLVGELADINGLTLFESYGNFVYIKCDANKIADALKNRVSIRYFGKDYVRVTVGTQEENRELIRLLKENIR